MVTTKYIKLGWCNQFVAGRITLDELTTYVPEVLTKPIFFEDLKRRRELRRLEYLQKQSGKKLSFAERYPATKAFAQLVKHAQEVTGMK